MTREYAKPVVVPCTHCGASNAFNQPYPYHAGFGDQGFLYNESGICTLVWSAFDPDFEALVGKHNPWVLSREKQQILEDALRPAPDGSRWLFSNPARCLTCGHPISEPMCQTIYYLEYEGSINVDPLGHPGTGLKDVLKGVVELGAGPNMKPEGNDRFSALRRLNFIKSRIPALDAITTFVPNGHENDEATIKAREKTGLSRWIPVEGGHKVLILFEGGEYDTDRFQLEKGAWDHEHCKICNITIEPMTLCWVSEKGPYVVLCETCHDEKRKGSDTGT